MPYSHGSSVVNDGVLDGTTRQGAISFQNSNDNDIDLDTLTFQICLVMVILLTQGFSAQLPVFDNGENPVY